MSKSRSQITSKLNDWYGWLIGHVPRTIKDGASRAFKTSHKIMGFYNGFTGNQTQCRTAVDHLSQWSNLSKVLTESYRIDGRPRMDVDTFFSRIRSELIGLIAS